MKAAICEKFGIDFPLFVFSHCRDVVAAVTNAGGFGVLGAVAYTPDQLEQEMSWIDEHVHGKPYGADIIVPCAASTRWPPEVIPARRRWPHTGSGRASA